MRYQHIIIQQTMTKDQRDPTMTDIRRELITANRPEFMQQMSQACVRIQSGEPTAEDYRIVLAHPGIASMFMRSKK